MRVNVRGPSTKRLSVGGRCKLSPISIDQHIPVRWAVADLVDIIYFSGCCKQYASTVKRCARKSRGLENSLPISLENNSSQLVSPSTFGAPQEGQSIIEVTILPTDA